MKKLSLVLMLPSIVWAQDHCVLQDRVVSRSEVVIAERSPIRRDVVPYFDGRKKCMVDFRIRIGRDWHTAIGEHVWEGHRPADEACAIAVARAEDSVRQRVGSSQTASERVLVENVPRCSMPALENTKHCGISKWAVLPEQLACEQKDRMP